MRSDLIDGFGGIVAPKNAHILKKVMFATVEAFLRGALFRKESRAPMASLLRKTEYPARGDATWLKHTLFRCVNGRMRLTTKEVKRLKKE